MLPGDPVDHVAERPAVPLQGSAPPPATPPPEVGGDGDDGDGYSAVVDSDDDNLVQVAATEVPHRAPVWNDPRKAAEADFASFFSTLSKSHKRHPRASAGPARSPAIELAATKARALAHLKARAAARAQAKAGQLRLPGLDDLVARARKAEQTIHRPAPTDSLEEGPAGGALALRPSGRVAQRTSAISQTEDMVREMSTLLHSKPALERSLPKAKAQARQRDLQELETRVHRMSRLVAKTQPASPKPAGPTSDAATRFFENKRPTLLPPAAHKAERRGGAAPPGAPLTGFHMPPITSKQVAHKSEEASTPKKVEGDHTAVPAAPAEAAPKLHDTLARLGLGEVNMETSAAAAVTAAGAKAQESWSASIREWCRSSHCQMALSVALPVALIATAMGAAMLYWRERGGPVMEPKEKAQASDAFNAWINGQGNEPLHSPHAITHECDCKA